MKYYLFKAEDKMNCDVRLFASKEIYQEIEKSALQQLFNASQLPGMLSVIGLPDIHQGYGLPIGGVMVSSLEDGVISPGAVGFDINCGVRLLKSNLTESDIQENLDQITDLFQRKIPAGLGVDSEMNFTEKEFKKIVEKGIPYLVNKQSYGNKQDMQACENQGFIENASFAQVSKKARQRGIKQLGCLGSGNHFIEIQKINKIFDNNFAFNPETVTFMIHTGSRGFGHQIASDYIAQAKELNPQYEFNLPVKNLAAFPVNSKEGQNYFQAMACAANFAFANRQLITHKLRNLLKNIFPEAKLELFYDITHNIARKETHTIDNLKQQVLVHRKGATRLAADSIALLPGSMGTASFVVKSLNSEATRLSFQSVAHGAGRTMGRKEARRTITQKEHRKSLGETRVISSSGSNLLDESPLAYKKIKSVINSLEKTELAEPVVELKPLLVLKG